MIEKIKKFFSSFASLSLNVGWSEKKMMNSSRSECEICDVHFKGIKGESGCIYSKVC